MASGHADWEPVLVLDGGTIIELSFAAIRGITPVKPASEERRALPAACYELKEETP